MRIYTDMPLHPDAAAEIERDGTLVGRDDPKLKDWATDADAVIFGFLPIDDSTLGEAPRLKVAAKHGVGIETVDLDACRRRGIRVTWTPGGNSRAVAELAVGLSISVARNIALGDTHMRPGGTLGRQELIGVELRGRTAGFLGMGRIARAALPMFGSGLGMTVKGFDPGVADGDWPEGAGRAASLAALLAESDLLVVLVPLNEGTRGMIGAAELKRMKPNAILVNVTRGGIVDEDALAAALRDGTIAGAASDVFAAEPPPPDHPLLGLHNFVGTRHIGGYTDTALRDIGLACVRQIRAVLSGAEPEDAVV